MINVHRACRVPYFSYLDINPLACGRSLVISNVRSYGNHSRHKVTHHTYISLLNVDMAWREGLKDSLIVTRIAVASGFDNHNILQVGSLTLCITSH